MKPRHVVLGFALAAAAGLVLFGDRTPAGEAAPALARPVALAAAQHPETMKRAAAGEPAILRLQPRQALVGGAGNAGDDAFASRSWTPPPPPPPPEPPPPAPTAPPLPFTYIGKALEEGSWEVYLVRGERAYVVHDKDVVDGSYRVDAIRPPLMVLTYLPLNQVQQINIGVFD